MSLSDEVPYFTGERQFGHVRPLAVLYSICCQPATRTRNSRSQRRDRQNLTMSSA